MILNSNAKINLGLFVTERRNDGFHNLESIFLPIPWSDQIEIQEASSFSFSSEGIAIPESGKPNLCEQAYELLKAEFQIAPVQIHLTKNIPIGAGLGGGSSNAAFVLKGLNELFQLNLSLNELEQRALKLGSDCAFFIRNKKALVRGRGDLMDFDINLEIKSQLLMVNPGIHISTQEAYAGIQVKPSEIDWLEISKLPVKRWKEFLRNDFEAGAIKKYPELGKLKKELYEAGADYVSMTGSGSTFYAFFKQIPSDLKLKAHYLKKELAIHIT